ncbi:MAG: amino acid permease [Janthinobacterium lividum]
MSQIDAYSADNRRLGWGVAALVVAGNMIGSGVYLLPVTLAPTGSSSLIGWIVCGIGAVTLALVFGGLGRMPKADGLADFASQGLGRFLGYQAGLFYWAACLVGNVAVAVAAVGYLAFFFPVLREPVWGAAANLGLLWITTGIYALGTRSAARFGALSLAIGLVPIVLAIIAGAMAFDGSLFAASWSPSGEALTKTVPASLAIIFWAFLGVESAAVLSARVKNPSRDVGLASVMGVLLAFAVYVAACVAVFGVIPAGVLAESTSPFADLVARVMGASVAGLVAACAVIKTCGTIVGWTMTGGETARAAAEKGWLPRGFGGAQAGKTPWTNPVLMGGIMSVLLLISVQPSLGKQFEMLIGVTSVLTLCLYAVCSLSLLKVAKGWHWRLLGVLGLVFSAFAVVAAAGGYVLPSLGFFAVTSLAWFWVRHRKATNIDLNAG